MRRIDFFAGTILCLLLDIWFKFIRLFRRRKAATPKKILFIELSEMGSAIIADPAMRLARTKGAEIYFAIFAKNAVSLKLLGTVPPENIFTLPADGLWGLSTGVLRFLVWCRRQRIDTVIDLELFARFTALLSGLSGAVNRIGFHAFYNEGLYRGNFLTHPVAYNSHRHVAISFLALVYAAYTPEVELPYTKRQIADSEARLAQALQNEEAGAEILTIIGGLIPDFDAGRHQLILINPNASDLLPQRRWMPERFVEVMQRLAARYSDARVLITGAPAEQEQAEELCRQVDHPHCRSIAGKLQVEQLIPLYQCSRLMLTNDSGPAHFAAVTPLKTFVIFGPETPALYRSLGNTTPIYAGFACSPCVSAANHRKTPCRNNSCLQAISANHVFALLCDELDKNVEPQTSTSRAITEAYG